MQHLLRIAFIAVAVCATPPASLAAPNEKTDPAKTEAKAVPSNSPAPAQPMPETLPAARPSAPSPASANLEPQPIPQQSMWPVVIGGLLALAGVVVAQFLTHAFSARRERDKLLREKAEDLCKALYALSNWLHNGARAITSEVEHTDQIPIDRVHTIQSLYFPELAAPFSLLANTSAVVVQTISQQHQLVLEANKNQKVAELRFETTKKNSPNADAAEVLAAMETASNTRIQAIRNATASFAPFHDAMHRATEAVIKTTQKRTAAPAWKGS